MKLLGWEYTRASRNIIFSLHQINRSCFYPVPWAPHKDGQMDPANHSVPQLHHTNVLEGKLLQHQEQAYYSSPETTACVFTFLFQVSDLFRKQEANLMLLTSNPLEEGCLICLSAWQGDTNLGPLSTSPDQTHVKSTQPPQALKVKRTQQEKYLQVIRQHKMQCFKQSWHTLWKS